MQEMPGRSALVEIEELTENLAALKGCFTDQEIAVMYRWTMIPSQSLMITS